MWRSILLAFFYCLFAGFAKGAIEKQRNVSAIKHVQVFEDRSGVMSFAQVQKQTFVKRTEDVLNFGILKSAVWLRFSVQNRTDDSLFYLSIEQPIINEVSLYQQKDGRWFAERLGEYKEFKERFVDNPNYIFPICLKPDSLKVFYLRVASFDQLQFPIIIGTKEQILQRQITREGVMGIYVGIVFIMMAYNLFLYFSVRDKSYLYYILYIFFVGLTQVNFKGYAFAFLWPNSPWLAMNSSYLIPALSGLTTAIFVWEFLMVRVYAPRFGKGVIIYSIGCTAAALLGICGFRMLGVQLMQVMALLGVVYLLLLANYVRKEGYHAALYFLLAFISFIFSIIVFVLTSFGVLPMNFFTGNVLELGSTLQILLLSFALADRINTYRAEKEKSQAEALRFSRENARIINEQNQLLEKEVAKRTADLQLANQDLHDAFRDLKQAQSQLVQAEKMASLGVLTAGIAHEINNPINFVSSGIGPLKRDFDDFMELFSAVEHIALENSSIAEKQAKLQLLKDEADLPYLKEEINALMGGIEDGAVRTAEIVKSLRVFSRVDEDDLKLVDINQGIESTLVILNSQIRNHILIEKRLGNLPLVECYPGKMNQVFLNIISNAVSAIKQKFGERKGGNLLIESVAREDFVRITFTDNGMGIKKEILARIFEPFFTTKEVGEGTGLGLSIVMQILEKHHATVQVESEEGEWTSFVFEIPIHQ